MLFLRSFDACYHAELQDMWYKAHYKEAESVRGRSLGECVFHIQGTRKKYVFLLSRTQAGSGRTVKQEQEEISRNHVQTFISPSV